MPKLTSLKLALVLVAVLTVAGVGYASLVVWRERVSIDTKGLISREKPTREGQPMVELPSPTEAAAPSLLDTSNWKTYRNEVVGFELKYPQAFGKPYVSTATDVPTPGLDGGTRNINGTEDNTTISFDKPSTYKSNGGRIQLILFPYSSTLDELRDDPYASPYYFDYDSPTKKVKDFFIDGKEASWYITTKNKIGPNNDNNQGAESDMEIFFIGNGHAFILQARLDHDREELEQMLSTFKFTR